MIEFSVQADYEYSKKVGLTVSGALLVILLNEISAVAMSLNLF